MSDTIKKYKISLCGLGLSWWHVPVGKDLLDAYKNEGDDEPLNDWVCENDYDKEKSFYPDVGTLRVYNEEDKLVFACPDDIDFFIEDGELRATNCEVDYEYLGDQLKPGELYYVECQKGTWGTFELELDEEFDPRKLKIYICSVCGEGYRGFPSEMQGDVLITDIDYDGKSLSEGNILNDFYTHGKSLEFRIG